MKNHLGWLSFGRFIIHIWGLGEVKTTSSYEKTMEKPLQGNAGSHLQGGQPMGTKAILEALRSVGEAMGGFTSSTSSPWLLEGFFYLGYFFSPEGLVATPLAVGIYTLKFNLARLPLEKMMWMENKLSCLGFGIFSGGELLNFGRCNVLGLLPILFLRLTEFCKC